MFGSANAGSRAGISPTTFTPRPSSPNAETSHAISATTIKRSGSSGSPSRRLPQRSAITSAIAPMPIAAVSIWTPPPYASVWNSRYRK